MPTVASHGALYLAKLDQRMETTGVFYARFMDDWVVLAPTRWALRRAVRLVKPDSDRIRHFKNVLSGFMSKVRRRAASGNTFGAGSST